MPIMRARAPTSRAVRGPAHGESTAAAETPTCPHASLLYAKKVAHVTEALNRPEDRAGAWGRPSPEWPDRAYRAPPWRRARPNRCHASWTVEYHSELDSDL